MFLILQSPKAKKGKPETEAAESAESPVVSNLFRALDEIPYLYSISYYILIFSTLDKIVYHYHIYILINMAAHCTFGPINDILYSKLQ